MDKKAHSGNPSAQPDPSAARANPLPGCPMAAAFAALGGKWKLTIVYWLAHDETHFAGLRHRVAPISAKVLAEQLRELQADGLVERLETGPVPAPVLYRLTAYGLTALPVVESVRVWGAAHLEQAGMPLGDRRAGCADAVA
jgi:DNA-binding HxlR family transcriptional regulator